MPGTPKKRRRREEEAAAAAAQEQAAEPAPTAPPVPDNPPSAIHAPAPTPAIPPAPNAPPAAPAAAPAPPPAQPRVVTPRRGPTTAPGAVVRSTVDHMQADEIAKLAGVLRPGLTLSIERTRPNWCSGWVGDFEAQDGDITELREYMDDEFGGQSYKVSVIDPGGQILFVTQMKIAGQPKRDGLVIDRRTWEGRPAAPPQPQQQASSDGSGTMMEAMGKIFENLLGVTTRNADRTLEAVEKMGANQTENTRRLIETIVEGREKTDRKSSFVHTLNEVREANAAMRDVKDALREDDPAAPPPHQDENILQGIAKDLGKDLLAGAARKHLGASTGNPTGKKPVDLPAAISDPGKDVRRRP